MEPQQNLTKADDDIDFKAIEASMYVLTPQQQVWVDYKALSGIVIENDTMRKMPVSELAQKLGVSRETLYSWRNLIPNFWDKVAARRAELHSQEWLAKMHETWKLKALKFDNWPLTEAWMINFDPDYKSPKLKVQHELGDSWAALLSNKRDLIEGEVVNEPNADQP